MTGADLKAWRDRLSLSQELIARAARYSLRHYQRFELMDTVPGRAASTLQTVLTACEKELNDGKP